jgi:hypothetical protein
MLSQLVVAAARNAAGADVINAAPATNSDARSVAGPVALLLALLDLCGIEGWQ